MFSSLAIESIDTFVAALYTGTFVDLRLWPSKVDNFIRDQVVATTNSDFFENDFWKVQRRGWSVEEAARHSKELSSSTTSASVGTVDKRRDPPATKAATPLLKSKSCYCCGSQQPVANSPNCKARDMTRSKCGKCDETSEVLSALHVAEECTTYMRIEGKVQAVTATLLVDAGSAVSISSSATYSKLKCPALLQQIWALLFDYSHRNIA
ncbi:hypothetical protein HPB47_002516, partial [Ixodes persulcatus]